MAGRNSIANEIEPAYIEIAKQRISKLIKQPKLVGATEAELILDPVASKTRISAADGIQAAV
jgi:hypothetical protein